MPLIFFATKTAPIVKNTKGGKNHAMGLILGILGILAGAIGIKYSVIAIVAGVSAIMVFFGLRKE